MLSTLRVAVIDERLLVRESLSEQLMRDSDLDVSHVATVDELADRTAFDVLVAGAGAPTVLARSRVVQLRADTTIEALRREVRAAGQDHGRRRLTPREEAVLDGVSNGHSSIEIAQMLGISPRTVHRHREAAMGKLGTRSRAEAVARMIGHDVMRNAG